MKREKQVSPIMTLYFKDISPLRNSLNLVVIPYIKEPPRYGKDSLQVSEQKLRINK